MNFSVLISLYYKESPEYLTESLNSVLSQTFKASEIVLVKDGPLTKDLDDVINSFVEQNSNLFKIISLDVNSGLGKALNIGLNNCSFEIVARMDSDDICHPERFEKQIKILKDDDNIDLVGSWIDEFSDTKENVISQRKVPELHRDILKYAQLRSPFNHPSVMFRKNAILDIGNYQPFGTYEDYLLWARFLTYGKIAYNLQESLVYFRMSSDMFKRRGGLKKTLQEIKLQNKFLEIGFITKVQYLKNLTVRAVFRALPSSLRGIIYKVIFSKL